MLGRVLTGAIAVLVFCGSAGAGVGSERGCSARDLDAYTNEDCGQSTRDWRQETDVYYPKGAIYHADTGRYEITRGILIAAGHYRTTAHQFRVGHSAMAQTGDSDPECGTALSVQGIALTHPSSCAIFCADVPGSAITSVYFQVYEDDGTFLGSCSPPTSTGICQFDWASVHRSAQTCAEFRNWSHNRTRRVRIEVVQRLGS